MAAQAAAHPAAHTSDDTFDDDTKRIQEKVPTWDNGTGITARFLKEATGARISLIYVAATAPAFNKELNLWVTEAKAKVDGKIVGTFAILMKDITAGRHEGSPESGGIYGVLTATSASDRPAYADRRWHQTFDAFTISKSLRQLAHDSPSRASMRRRPGVGTEGEPNAGWRRRRASRASPMRNHHAHPALRSARTTAGPHTPAATSSFIKPHPAGSVRSNRRAGHGLIWSKTRNATNPIATLPHDGPATASVISTPAGHLIDDHDLRVLLPAAAITWSAARHGRRRRGRVRSASSARAMKLRSSTCEESAPRLR